MSIAGSLAVEMRRLLFADSGQARMTSIKTVGEVYIVIYRREQGGIAGEGPCKLFSGSLDILQGFFCGFMNKHFVVVKIGSSLAVSDGRVNRQLFEHLALQVKELVDAGTGVCLVVSGAVRLGSQLGAACSDSLSAGMGQALLSGELFPLFQQNGLLLSQLLVTKEDFLYKGRREHLCVLLEEAREKDIVFLANENDAVALHSFGGNDFLASEIAQLIGATHLLLLTDVDGVYGSDMQVIKEFDSTYPIRSFSHAFLKKSVGGIESKVQAALESASVGVETFIASGRKRDMIRNIVIENHHVGTRFRKEI
jgi:glutamate 5-kinase